MYVNLPATIAAKRSKSHKPMANLYVLVEINSAKVANLLERHSFSDSMKKDINKELMFCHQLFFGSCDIFLKLFEAKEKG